MPNQTATIASYYSQSVSQSFSQIARKKKKKRQTDKQGNKNQISSVLIHSFSKSTASCWGRGVVLDKSDSQPFNKQLASYKEVLAANYIQTYSATSLEPVFVSKPANNVFLRTTIVYNVL